MIALMFTISVVYAADNTTSDVIGVDEAIEVNNLYDDVISVDDFENGTFINNQNILESNESRDEILSYDEEDCPKSTIEASSNSHTYPSYSDYSVNVSDVTIFYESGGVISMKISSTSDSTYKYYYYLKVYDLNNNLKISQLYSSTRSSDYEVYRLDSKSLNSKVYKIEIINYADNHVMDTARLTIKSSYDPSNYPYSSHYSVDVSDTIIDEWSSGSISMSISPASNSAYKYDFYLKVYDSNNNEKISEEYSSTSFSYSETYSLNSKSLDNGVYTIKIINRIDKKVMDTAKLTIRPLSVYPYSTDYSVSVSDTTITYGVGGSIFMNITPAYNRNYHYCYYLKVYDSRNNEKISELYSDKYYYYSETYNLDSKDLTPGVYTIKIINYEDNQVMDTANLIVNKASTKVSGSDVTKYYAGSEKFTVKVSDGNGKALANKEVEITLNGQTYNRTTDSNGNAVLALNLNSGVYPTTFECDGIKSKATVTVKSTVSGKDITKVYKNSTQYSARFVDSKGNPLKNRDVKFNINGIYYTRKTNENGVAGLNINLVQGKYTITAINPSNNEKCSNTVTILSKITKNKDISLYYKDGTRYGVQLIGNNGKPVGSEEKVIFNINGVIYQRITDGNGYAGLNINLLPQKYIITAEYCGCRVSNEITVKDILYTTDFITNPHSKVSYKVQLLAGQGNPYVNAKVTFNINGRIYERTTDGEGYASLTIDLPEGKYTITSSYNGLNKANEITVRNNDYNYNYNTNTNTNSNTNTNTNTNTNGGYWTNGQRFSYVDINNKNRGPFYKLPIQGTNDYITFYFYYYNLNNPYLSISNTGNYYVGSLEGRVPKEIWGIDNFGREVHAYWTTGGYYQKIVVY